MRATLNDSRTVHAPFTVSDEQLEHYGRIYLSAPRRMSFEHFLAMQLRCAGLLPSQRALRARLDYALSSKERAVLAKALERSVRVVENGRLTEPLRHHRWPRGRRDFIPEGK